MPLRQRVRILGESFCRITSARVEALMISAFALVQVAVEYGVLTSRNMASFRNALAGIETQTWVIGVSLLVLGSAASPSAVPASGDRSWPAGLVAVSPVASTSDRNAGDSHSSTPPARRLRAVPTAPSVAQ